MKAVLKNGKTHNDVVQISFTDEELEQLEWEGDDEFCFGGEMYDVVQKIKNGNKTVVVCIPDKKESALLNEYQKTHKRNTSNSAISQLFSMQSVLPADCSLQQPQKIIENYFRHYFVSWQNLVLNIISPPPDVSSFFTTF